MKKINKNILPLKEMNESAMAEKVKKGHPGNLHLWWNRSPIDSSAALLYSTLKEKDAIVPPVERISIIEKVKEISSGKYEGINFDDNKMPIIYDPFSGFGGLAIAAQKLGLQVQASDLNPVATLLTKASTEIPGLFKNQKAVNPKENKICLGVDGLASDVEYYGKKMLETVKKKVSSSYPVCNHDGENHQVHSWVWVRTITCPNPACNCKMPLSNSFVLSKMKGNEYWAEPIFSEKKLSFRIHSEICPTDKEGNKHGSKGSKFICPSCGEIATDENIKTLGKQGKIENQLMAISLIIPDGKIFVEANPEQINAALTEKTKDFLLGSIPDNTRWFSPPIFGMSEYSDLFTPRQLLLMETFCDTLLEIQSEVYSDSIIAGMSLKKKSLSERGNGALAYSQAIAVYLALSIGKLANYQSSICTWDNRTGNIRAAFSQNAIPMTWVFGEGNPFSSVTGNYRKILGNLVESVKNLSIKESAVVQQKDALIADYPDNAILFTELPYSDYIGYADLSDYFYVWLRKCLKLVYPELFKENLTSKNELSSISEHYNKDRNAAIQAYQNGISHFFNHFYLSSSCDFSSIVFFQYHIADDRMIKSEEQPVEMTPFEQFLDSIIKAGFRIEALYPMRTENGKAQKSSYRVAIVFRKVKENLEITTRRNWINILKRNLPEKYEDFISNYLDEEIQKIAGLGVGLDIFTQFNKIMNADGSKMCIRDALQIIYQEISSMMISQS